MTRRPKRKLRWLSWLHAKVLKFWKAAEPYAKILGAITALAGIVAFFVIVVFDQDPRYDATARFDSERDRYVQPVVDYGNGVARAAKAAGHESVTTYGEFLRKHIEAEKMGDKVSGAADSLNELVKCKQSVFCVVKNYDRQRETIQHFWYTFRPYLMTERGKTLTTRFAAELESEAKKILDELREGGHIPKPSSDSSGKN